MDWKLELVAVPVSDVDRAKAFYADQVGLQRRPRPQGQRGAPLRPADPPGSACSIAIGTGITDAKPGSVVGLQIVVSDVAAARAELDGRGVAVTEVQEFPWGKFVFFKDPDGNGWALQELQPRP